MLRRIREPFGKAGLIVAIVALIAALVGGAYAASGGLSGKQKKEVKKIAKEFAGKNGGQGPAGQNGAQGPKGDSGAAGANGTNGKDGEPGEIGKEGKAGKSVSVFSLAPGNGEGCEETGGAKFTNGTETAFACNGKDGEAGGGGGGTLPSGRTMMGMWEVQGEQAGHAFGSAFTTISFPVPLATAPTKTILIHVLKNNTEEEEEDCPGTGEAPEALPGFLCLYPQFEPETVTLKNGLAFTYGAGLLFAEPDTALGSWAVTAP